MNIETVSDNLGGNYLDVTIRDCEGFTIQENMDASNLPEYAESLMNSLYQVFAFLDMSQGDIIKVLEESHIYTQGES